MRNRRLMFSAALIAAGVGLAPGLAQAAPAAPGGAAGDGRTVATSDVDLKKTGAAAPKKFSSPADRTVRTAPPAAKAAPQGLSAAAEAASGPKVELDGATDTAHGLSLVTDISNAPNPVAISVDWGDGTSTQAQAPGNGQVPSDHVFKKSGPIVVTVTVTDTVTGVKGTNKLEATLLGSDFTPYAPTRLLDTRSGVGVAKGKVPAYRSTFVKIAGNGTIPAGVTAVALNVTVTNPTADGHITASQVLYPGEERPETSNVNYVAGQTVPNMVIVPVGPDGSVELYNGGWESVDLIADVTGYFTQTAASGYTSLNPVRFVDTRSGLGTGKGQVAGYTDFSTQIAGRDGVPQGAKAVALNVTVTGPQAPGHLTAFPTGGQVPTTSNVNFTAGQTVANSVIVPIGADGKISIRNGSWNPADVVVDVVGYYSPDSQAAYMPLIPGRIEDTRQDVEGPIPVRSYIALNISDGEPGIEGYALNTTVTNTADNGFLSVAPDPNSWEEILAGKDYTPDRPVSSALNWTRGKTVPNLVQASAGKNGVVDFWNQSFGPADLIVDIFGYYEYK